jgi:hypothetical protein
LNAAIGASRFDRVPNRQGRLSPTSKYTSRNRYKANAALGPAREGYWTSSTQRAAFPSQGFLIAPFV